MIKVALIEGLIWSCMWMIYIFLILKFFPWTLLHDYPQDIKEASTLPPPTDKETKNSKIYNGIASSIIFITLLVFAVSYFYSARVGYLEVLLFVFIISMMWNVVDLLIMDWILVCTVTPSIVVIEGTEGCKGYKDYFFHFKGFLIGCIYTTIMALLFSGIAYAILYFVIWK